MSSLVAYIVYHRRPILICRRPIVALSYVYPVVYHRPTFSSIVAYRRSKPYHIHLSSSCVYIYRCCRVSYVCLLSVCAYLSLPAV
jgi:hypothetical protein